MTDHYKESLYLKELLDGYAKSQHRKDLIEELGVIVDGLT